MNAVFLLACHFEQPRSRLSNELGQTFLSKALHEINVALDKSDRLVDIVQASCLLAVYFYLNSRILEAYCHSFAAARLAVGLGLHQIRPLNPTEPPLSTSIPIVPPMNEIEFRERVAVFWQVFVVDRLWSIASGLPVALTDSSRLATIKTPWPKPPSTACVSLLFFSSFCSLCAQKDVWSTFFRDNVNYVSKPSIGTNRRHDFPAFLTCESSRIV